MGNPAASSLRDRCREAILSTPIGYRLWVRRNMGGRLRPRRLPRPGPACAVLRSRAEVDDAVREVREIGLPDFGIHEKYWDALSAVSSILGSTGKSEEVLDAGAETYSPVLPWLSLYGYRRLTGCNLVFDRRLRRGDIVYEHGDITATRYAGGRFAAVACMSVIEHGVDPEAFFAEMGRIVRPGGTLIVSTDYWQVPIDAGGRTAFGVPVKVFCQDDIGRLLRLAACRGFEPVAPIDPACGEPVISWNGLRYTFLLITFRKGA